MKTGIINSKKEFKELPIYNIQGLMETIVNVAIKSPKYKEKFEQYQKKVTRFSPELEFCMHELGWMIYDPFLSGKDEVLFSNGNRYLLASWDYINKDSFNRKAIDVDLGFPILTDENIRYDKNVKTESIRNGFIDSQGYIDVSFASTPNNAADIIVFERLIRDKDAYDKYQASKDLYVDNFSYLTSQKNVIFAKRLEDGNLSLQYVSDNDGKVRDIINRLDKEGIIKEFIPITQNGNLDLKIQEDEEYDLLVQEETEDKNNMRKAA